MLKLKLQYFGHPMQTANLLEKTLVLGKIAGRMRREWQRMRWLDGTIDSMGMNLGKLVLAQPWLPGHGVAPPGHNHWRQAAGSSSQPQPQTSDVGYLLLAAPALSQPDTLAAAPTSDVG